MHETHESQVLPKSNYEVEFIQETHTYIYEGVMIPSVSAIMSPMSEKKYATISKGRLENAADRGTRVHNSVEVFEKYGLITHDKEIKPYLLAYRVAKKLHNFEVLDTERKLTNGRYGGTLDMIARLDGKIIIIDLKATSVINYDLLEVQLAAYHELCRANNIDIHETWVLHLKPGSFKFVQIQPNFPLWTHLLEHYEQTNQSM
jgi:hypothetical protein